MFWFISLILDDAPVEEFTPIVVPDVDPTKPLPTPPSGLL